MQSRTAQPGGLKEQSGRFPCNIFIVQGNIINTGSQPQLAPRLTLHGHPIGHAHALHNHKQIMVAVGAATDNIQH